MLNFTVGPVQACESVLAIGGEQVPYFRTPEFSRIMLENEALMLKFAQAPENSRCVFLTGSGTAAMESVVMNTLTPFDKCIVINGGSFGHRFVELLTLHRIPFSEVALASGKALTHDMLDAFDNQGYTAFLVNVHETSTGVLYDMEIISEFCRRNSLFLIVDAISSFIADDFCMEQYGAGVMITGSQKALACPPGVSVIVLSPAALARVDRHGCSCLYLDLKNALKDMERGQTPFTPAVGVLLQINARLKDIDANGGIEAETSRIAGLANYFRERIVGLPFTIFSESMSNAVTPLHPTRASAYDIFSVLKDQYEIWVCPNGGNLRDSVFRVGHLGHLVTDDYDKLIWAFRQMMTKRLI